jgi:DNA-binding transcriptional regulator GbsR (MarR family)
VTPADALMDFAARAATELASQGFPSMPARVIMALTASEDGQLTAEELSEQLSASPAAISGAVRYLATLGFLRASTLRGSRRHVYTLPHSPWYTASLTGPGRYRNIIEILESGTAGMPEDSSARSRIEEMADFFRFFERRMPQLLEEWKASRRST